jgi:hypothetical protein
MHLVLLLRQQVGLLINKDTGVELAPYQVQAMRTKAIAESLRIHIGELGVGEKATPGDKLLAELAADPKISYTVLFGNYDEAGTITIKRKKRNANAQGQGAPLEEELLTC